MQPAVAPAGFSTWQPAMLGRPADFGQYRPLMKQAAALSLLIAALVVTMGIEVPIVASFRGKTVASLPAKWQFQRDRWVSFHLLRVLSGAGALALLVAGVTVLNG
jgi:uncharacterized membrane protein